MKPEAQLPVVHSFAAAVYQIELFNLQQQNAVVRVKKLTTCSLMLHSQTVKEHKRGSLLCKTRLNSLAMVLPIA